MRRPTRHAGSQGDEGDGIDTILEVDEASKMTRDIANDSSVCTNEENGNNKCRISIVNS